MERGSNMIWRMMYEPAPLMPLAKLSVHDLYRDRAMTTYNAVLDAMEAPVRQDLEARRREPVRTRREMEQAARLFSIEAFRRGPYFKQMEHGIYVKLTSVEDTVELMSRAEEVGEDGRQDDTDTVHDASADEVIEYQDRPTCSARLAKVEGSGRRRERPTVRPGKPSCRSKTHYLISRSY
jgi:hypothetical protein